MCNSVKRLVALILLLAVPVQGLAAVLMPFHCLPDGPHERLISASDQRAHGTPHEHGKSSHAVSQHNADEGAATGHGETGHKCCNHVSTGVAMVAAVFAPGVPFVAVNHIASILPPFFPDRLLRPPRT